MAKQTKTSSRSPARRSQNGSRNGRSASQKTERYRFAQNVGGRATAAEREYRAYASGGNDPSGEPDVLLDVPVVKVDSIHFELDNLDAHVALKAQVLDLVKLNVGVDVHLGRVKLDIKGVEAQALLKVRLDHVAAIVDRVLTTLDRNPELVKSLGKAVEDVGAGAGRALDDTGDAVEDVGQGAEGAVKDVGQGAGKAAGELGQGAGEAVGQIGEGAGQAVGEVGQGAGEAAGQVGQGAGQALGDVGQGVGQTVGSLDQTVAGLGQSAGQLAGAAGGAAGQPGQGGDGQGAGAEQSNGPAAPGASPGQVAKVAALLVAKELGSAASDEAKDLGLAATRKARELSERRRQRRADKHNATEAAMRTAEELGVDIDTIDGTGAEGRVTVRDVREAVES